MKNFKELSGGISLNSGEMFALKGGFVAKAYGCKSAFCLNGQFICKENKEREISSYCSTAVCESEAFPSPTCTNNQVTVIQPPVWCVEKIQGK